MLEFKKWFENEEFPLEPSEYDPPDESEMNRIREIPLKCRNVPNLHGDHFQFILPMGKEDFLITKGGSIGLRAARGSLNARCFDLLSKNKYKELHKLLNFIRNNQNQKIKNQLISYRKI